MCVDFQDQRQKTCKWERLDDVESNVQLKSLEYESYDKQWDSDCPGPFVPTEPCHGQQLVWDGDLSFIFMYNNLVKHNQHYLIYNYNHFSTRVGVDVWLTL